jgi:hypothetical protein
MTTFPPAPIEVTKKAHYVMTMEVKVKPALKSRFEAPKEADEEDEA